MITELQIEEMVTEMEAEDFEDLFVDEQKDFWNYLNSEGFKGLSEAEHQMLFFITSVIYHTCKKAEYDVEVGVEDFQEYEEANWAVRDAEANFADAANKYFKDYKQEDLLAFVEDMLVEDEIKRLTDIGKEAIFITAKSYIDILSDVK